MEAVLNLRQAYISQQLMILKEAGLIAPRRDGLNLYYRIIKPELFHVLDALSSVTRVPAKPAPYKHANVDCPCPKCKVKSGNPLVQTTAA